MSDTDTLDDDPRPLLELASTPEVLHDALKLLDADAPRPLPQGRHDALFREAIARAKGRPSTPKLVLSFATACLLGAVITAALVSTLRPPEFIAADDAVAVLEGRTLTITKGHVDLQPRRALRVKAGHVELTFTAGRAAMDVTSEGVSVHVEEGEAMMRDGETRHRVTKGQALTSVTAPPVVEPELELPEARTESCASGAEACLTALAAGDGLEAETALYELALVAHEHGDAARANSLFAQHQQRFPEGVLAPEASIGLMLGHLALHDAAAASAEAHRFLARFPSDPRASRVRGLAR